MKTRIQVISVETRSGIGSKSQKAYSMVVCQCIVHGDKPQIGELILPKDHPEIQPGMYDGEFGVAVDFQTKRIGGVLIRLTPAPAASQVKAA